ncbi:hypothetical protein [Thiolapillus brandeum]|uniref:GNAT family N-acetyltransferase n=1 Tax=Thiolapillus brandeum TaxID=1076588 RepID=A0A7U6JHE0_9GAMM|nr:hypothetical protein [Thiolapillus brandeum]BAO43120.1 conserved hypothetical protein [Thiolapillus brandeum]
MREEVSRLNARAVPVAELDAARVEEMYGLFSRYYDGCSPTLFRGDLDSKDHCLLLENSRGRLCGFTTLAVTTHQVDGRPLRSLFSGDTIIHHEYWGSQTLPRAWCELAGRIKSQAPDLPLYWFLIVKGHRTYRYLKLFSRDYYPAPGREIPPDMRSIMDFLAGQRFGECYDAQSGVIRFPRSRGHLRPEWNALEAANRSKPDVAFFLQKNPGHGRGDELVCLTELDKKNLKRQALQAFIGGLET